MGDLDEKRVLVVGASSGIGRAIAMTLGASGARVVAAARRVESLEAMREESSGDLSTFKCDVRDPADCESVVAHTVDYLGGLDALVYCSGTSPLRALVDADAEIWRAVFETNVIGANLVCRAAMPALRDAHGTAIFLGSSSVGRPFPGLTAYAASKAALAESVLGWRAENPDVAFMSVVVGPTGDTEFTHGWDQAMAGEMFPFWQENGYLAASPSMTSEQVGTAVASLLTHPVSIHVARIEACDRSATALR